ncbi:MAG: FliH/SctL family protein [Alistipes senegalensis]|nr:FliH/SctL family protein [Oxalobacter formigenes]MCM1281482.1 FliH/SctL family protein [Alistipes senegalensis]
MYRKLPKEKQTAYERWELASFEEADLLDAGRKPVSPDEVDFGSELVIEEPEADLQWEVQEETAVEAVAAEGAVQEEVAGTFAGEDEQAGTQAEEAAEGAGPEPQMAAQEEETTEAVTAEEAVQAEVAEAFAGEGELEADQAGDVGPGAEAEPEVVEAPVVMAPTVTQATIEDVHALIEGLRKEAREAGYRAGMEEGLAKGLEEGRTRGYEEGLAKGLEEGTRRGETEGFEKGYGEGRLEGEEYARTLKAAAAGFAADVARAHEAIAGDVLALALDFAKAMMKTALKVKPELLVPVVADAVRYLPSLQQPAVLYLNPADAAVVRKAMGEELEKAGMRLAEEDVPRGSCRIETGSNQIDSSLATRWQRLTGSLGRESDWMEQE